MFARTPSLELWTYMDATVVKSYSLIEAASPVMSVPSLVIWTQVFLTLFGTILRSPRRLQMEDMISLSLFVKCFPHL